MPTFDPSVPPFPQFFLNCPKPKTTMSAVLFFDIEADKNTHKIEKIGYHSASTQGECKDPSILFQQAAAANWLCGHNIVDHDLPLLAGYPGWEVLMEKPAIDTLYLSPLLRPDLETHKLNKDYQLTTPWINDPIKDAVLAQDLYIDLKNKFWGLKPAERSIFVALLKDQAGFQGFFEAIGAEEEFEESGKRLGSSPTPTHPPESPHTPTHNTPTGITPPLTRDTATPNAPTPHTQTQTLIQSHHTPNICLYAPLHTLIQNTPIELAYCLALIADGKSEIITPSWLLGRFPKVQSVFDQLRSQNCGKADCPYCREQLDPRKQLFNFFNFKGFRRFKGDEPEGLPLQERAVRGALQDESLLAIFPTGGGKSLAFQLPALIRGVAKGALTVVISPLVSLMKDQVDNLQRRKGIVQAATLNGLLSPLERSEVIEKVREGTVNLLYVAPETLRSNTLLRLLTGRIIDRFVIDEAHCFSAWGQDFRVDYLYIAGFIQLLEKSKQSPGTIPVSCFTATARPEVVDDIRNYFRDKLGRELVLYQTFQSRENLTYRAVSSPSDEEKLNRLVNLLEETDKPVIVYVSRVRTTESLAVQLQRREVKAAAYHGKMEPRQKMKVQDDFKYGKVRVIVATSAFGMGVDKDDVHMVVHYEISNSLENYAQEAGRAGRKPDIQAKCVILFNEADLTKHFMLLQGTKLNKKEIDQIWRGIKSFKGKRISKSALEIAKAAGWDEDMRELETRVKTAINALEASNYVKREQNSPRVFAAGLLPDNLGKAVNIARKHAHLFTAKQREYVDRILQFLYGKEETRVDYMVEALGLPKYDTTSILNLFKEIGILHDHQDLTANVDISNSPYNSKRTFDRFFELEKALLEWLGGAEELTSRNLSLREANDAMEELGIKAGIPLIRNLLRYWEWSRFIRKERIQQGTDLFKITFREPVAEILETVTDRLAWSKRVLDYLLNLARTVGEGEEKREMGIEFSVWKIKRQMEAADQLKRSQSLPDYEKALLYLQAIEAIDLKGGLLVYYNRLIIQRVVTDNSKRYKEADYRQLKDFYRKKVEQVHIIGEYVQKLMRNYQEAMEFTDAYFQWDYKRFLRRYFPGRAAEIGRPMTPKKFKEIFGELSLEQMAVVKDHDHKRVLAAAGPGSGKTRVLVHKMASVLLLEDVKPEQFLMLAFSRQAALVFKTRLQKLVPGLAHHVEILTYHGFAFRLLGKIGDLDKVTDIIPAATEAIREKQVPMEKIAAKSVIVLDELQDITQAEFHLLQALIEGADQPRIIAAGDDDQAIYGFRGASAQYMRALIEHKSAQLYYLTTNYRSRKNIVEFANRFLAYLPAGDRLKNEAPLVPFSKENGHLRVVRYPNGLLLEPVVESAVSAWNNEVLSGTTAILVASNHQAVIVHSLLQDQNIPARLVATRSKFALRNLHELHFFTQLIFSGSRGELGLLPNKYWNKAVEHLKERFSTSQNLPLVLRFIYNFDRLNKNKYKTDWLEYLASLRIDEAFTPDRESIIVSTMHSAKGKEFDHVFLLLDGYLINKDENKRVVYVALTRAKQFLEIHTNMPYLDKFQGETIEWKTGIGKPEQPPHIALQCTLEDVGLWAFQREKTEKIIEALRAGDPLSYDPELDKWICTEKGERLFKFANKFLERLETYAGQGYRVTAMQVDHVVQWKGKEAKRAWLVVLPRVELSREG